jgi:hypothetical protein
MNFETPACQNMSLRADELGHQNYRVQFFGVGSLTVNRILYVCYGTAIFGVCNSVRLYSSSVKIRCQERNSRDCDRLRTLLGVTVNCEVWRRTIAL